MGIGSPASAGQYRQRGRWLGAALLDDYAAAIGAGCVLLAARSHRAQKRFHLDNINWRMRDNLQPLFLAHSVNDTGSRWLPNSLFTKLKDEKDWIRLVSGWAGVCQKPSMADLLSSPSISCSSGSHAPWASLNFGNVAPLQVQPSKVPQQVGEGVRLFGGLRPA